MCFPQIHRAICCRSSRSSRVVKNVLYRLDPHAVHVSVSGVCSDSKCAMGCDDPTLGTSPSKPISHGSFEAELLSPAVLRGPAWFCPLAPRALADHFMWQIELHGAPSARECAFHGRVVERLGKLFVFAGLYIDWMRRPWTRIHWHTNKLATSNSESLPLVLPQLLLKEDDARGQSLSSVSASCCVSLLWIRRAVLVSALSLETSHLALPHPQQHEVYLSPLNTQPQASNQTSPDAHTYICRHTLIQLMSVAAGACG